MADVTGIIGTEQVTLNNAATEATLKLLLQSSLAANKQSIESISKIATKAGLDPTAVEAANSNLNAMAGSASKGSGIFFKLGFAVGAAEQALGTMRKVLDPMIDAINSGSKNASDFGAALSGLPFGIGIVMGALGKLASIREKEFAAYQKMSDAGTTFGGSLSGLRMAAYNSYMTLDELTNVMTKNREAFSMMGGTVREGGMAFMKMSGDMMQSGVGNNLRALGYTAEQVSNGLASYIQNTGGRTKQEMQSAEVQKSLISGAKNYLEQLDALAQITGKSREELEKEQKQRNQNAAYQAKLMSMTKEQREATEFGATEMRSKFGKAGEEMYMASVLNTQAANPVARNLRAMAPEIAKASDKMVAIGKKGGSIDQMKDASSEATAGAATAAKRYQQVGGALSMAQGDISESYGIIQGAANRANQQGVETAQKGIEQRKEIEKKQQDLANSQAASAVGLQNATMNVQKALYSLLSPLIDMAGPVLLSFTTSLVELIMTAIKYKELIGGLLVVGWAYWTYQKAKMAWEVAQQARIAGKGVLGTIGAVTGIGMGALGSNPSNAMWVRVVGGGVLGGGGAAGGPLGGAGGAAGGAGKGGGGGMLQSLARGLTALGTPQAMLGAVTLGLLAGTLYITAKAVQEFASISWEAMAKGFVTLGGLGALAAVLGLATPFIIAGSAAIAAMSVALIPFAAAMGVMGLTLPLFVNGLDRIASLNSNSLSTIALSIGKLGVGLATWAPFGVIGIPAALSLNMLTTSLFRLSGLDTGKLDKVAASMQKIKDATPGVGQAIAGGITVLVNKAIGSSEPVATTTGTPATSTASSDSNNLVNELKSLNKQMADVLKYVRETADHTKQGVSATKSLGGNLFSF